MGYEKMESRVPCPCGKGTQVAEWEEHDTWSRGDEFGTYVLECGECAARYVYYWHTAQVWIRKEDALKLNSLESEAKESREQLRKIIVGRYEEPFVSHVLGLRNRTEMKYALGAGPGFFREAKDNLPYVEAETRKAIRERPLQSFARLGVQDAEVSGLTAKIDALQNERHELTKRMEKIPVPGKWGNAPKIPG